MEFNVFEYFKGYKRTTPGPMTPEEQGTSYFLAGHMGERISEHVDVYAAKAGLSRRNFLGTASGFAAAMLAVNEITGMKFFDVTKAEAADPAAAKEIKVARKPGADFIVDAHTHICWRKDGYIPGVNTSERGLWFVGLRETLDRMQMFVETYKISGLKLYTFDSTPQRGWWFDDQKKAYPMWEKARKLGIKNIGCHKGIPFGQFMARYAHAEDFDAVCDDFPDLNFIAYHSGWPYHAELAALEGFKPQRKNMYCEVGSTFAATVTSRPLECAHVLGTLLRDLGPDYV